MYILTWQLKNFQHLKFQINPRLRRMKIHAVRDMDDKRVAMTTILDVKTASLFIFFAIM